MNEQNLNTSSVRITVVDALRGFAVMAIMLLHNIEHFDYYYFPDYLPEWMKMIDKHVWEVMFALFSGKAYAIFAILFGLTFFIMDSKQQKLGKPFGARFMWRMLLLFAFGVINSMFYSGDVLALYAALGFTLVLVSRLKDSAVVIVAIILLLQPIEIIRLIGMYLHPEYQPGDPLSWHYFGLANEYLGGQSFWKTAWGNMTNGRWACTVWSWEQGRFLQIPALFMMGMLLGRTQRFARNDQNRRFWRNTMLISIGLGVVVYVVIRQLPNWTTRNVLVGQCNMILGSWNNVVLTLVWISAFVLMYETRLMHRLLSKLEVFGKMSLTNYVMQSAMGCFVYNGCGLALYQYTGASLSLMVGIVLFMVQYAFCRWWLGHHKQGPLEGIWHRMTWI